MSKWRKEKGANIPNFVTLVALRMMKGLVKTQVGYSIWHISPKRPRWVVLHCNRVTANIINKRCSEGSDDRISFFISLQGQMLHAEVSHIHSNKVLNISLEEQFVARDNNPIALAGNNASSGQTSLTPPIGRI